MRHTTRISLPGFIGVLTFLAVPACSKTASSSQTALLPATTMPTPQPRSTVVGDLRILKTFQSTHLGCGKTLRVWLPPGYANDISRRYPVLFLMDGQNLFDDRTSFMGEWGVDETLTWLISEGKVPPVIVVGIDHAQAGRADEYTPVVDEKYKDQVTPKADVFGKMIVEELIPFTDEHFRTDRATRYVGGSSLGGLVSLHLAKTHPGVFAGVIAMSPSLWWANGWLNREVARDPAPLQATRVWLDMGTAEEKDPQDQAMILQQVRALALTLNTAGVTTRYIEVEGAKHNEAAWRARFAQAIQFLSARP